MTVTFCGHGRINRPEELSSWLDMILPSLIEGVADTFYLGGYKVKKKFAEKRRKMR